MSCRKLIIALLLLSVPVSVFAQVNISGLVYSSDDKRPIPFASVTFRSENSSESISILTDLNGRFVISGFPIGIAYYTISSVGYVTNEGTVPVEFPSFGNDMELTIEMDLDVITLEEATVSASPVAQYANKTVYTITSKEVLNKSTGLDVLQTMPHLYLDEMTQTLKLLSGGKILILLDGAYATEADLKAMAPNQIKSVEYYDFPPARYSGYSKVINITSKYRSSGLSGGVGLQHAVSTWFANDDIYMMYNWNDNKLSFKWNFAYRDYRECLSESIYDYTLGSHINRKDSSIGRFGYSDNHVTLSYVRNVENKYLLQVTFSPDFQNSHSDNEGLVDYFRSDCSFSRNTYSSFKTSSFTPSLSLYSESRLANGQKLIFDLSGNYIGSSKSESMTEYNDTDLFMDISKQDNRKYAYSVSGEWVCPIGLSELSFGGKWSASKLYYSIDNSIGAGDFITANSDARIYGQGTGKIGRFSYLAILSCKRYAQNNDQTSYFSWYFLPACMFGFDLTDSFTVKFAYERSIEAPSLAQLSSNIVYITEDILRRGNPSLINSSYHTGALFAIYSRKWIDLGLAVASYTEKNPISSYFVKENDHISLLSENAINRKGWESFLETKISPFKNNLFEFTFRIEYDVISSNSIRTGMVKTQYFTLKSGLSFNLKHLSLGYMWNIPGYEQDGAFLNSEEKLSTLTASYDIKNFTISASVIGFVTGLPYNTKSISDDVVLYNFDKSILDNKNMFTIGFKYNFNLGRKVKNNTVNNDVVDTDSGLF